MGALILGRIDPLEGGIYMQHDQKQLHQIAQDYPWHVFTVEDIAILCNVSRDFVTRVRMAPDSPFCLNKCRPEWFTAWMREHPDFQLTKFPPPDDPPAPVKGGGAPVKPLPTPKMKRKPSALRAAA